MNELIIDNRMRSIEKEALVKLGYKLIETNTNLKLYPEIDSHPDIFFTKIKNNLIVEESQFEMCKNSVKTKINIVKGSKVLNQKYPNDIHYNVCIFGNYAIHNFKYTDNKVKEILDKEGYEQIDVNQGYTKCSIAVIDENSVIIADKGLYERLKNYNINILFLDHFLDIKLINENEISLMNGFIGGTISRVGDNVFISGDLNKIDKNNQIKNFIEKRNLNIISFGKLDVIDYGGILEI